MLCALAWGWLGLSLPGWARGGGLRPTPSGTGSPGRGHHKSWTASPATCCWADAGSGTGAGLGLWGAEPQSVEEPRAWLLSLRVRGMELRAKREVVSEVALPQAPWLPLSGGTLTEKRSDETLDWWMSMAATHKAGSGTALSAGKEGMLVTLPPAPPPRTLVRAGPS